MTQKLILTDADGVLLDYEHSLDCWLMAKGYTRDHNVPAAYQLAPAYKLPTPDFFRLVEEFNSSAALGFLPALRDAYQYVRELGAMGYRFVVISSAGSSTAINTLRSRNLHKLFGDVFESISCIDYHIPKSTLLRQYAGSQLYWIEDHIGNAEDGYDLGLTPLLMEHDYNMHFNSDRIQVVQTWKDIFQIITQSS